MEAFKPPVNYAMRTLDRAFFSKTIKISALRVFKKQDILPFRQHLERSKDLLAVPRLASVRPVPVGSAAEREAKCLLLNPNIASNDQSTWSEEIKKIVDGGRASLIPYELPLDYSHWNHYDILQAILPLELHAELPSGFSIVGHIAHLNLRKQFLPYGSLIADVIRDKAPRVRTVINKLDNVGTESVYRTFPYEVLVGEDEMNVEVRENDCTFKFDFSKVFWNPRLETEHRRMLSFFKEGEAVCDVMAGIGPFAVPAGKKRVFVWANDLNPDASAALRECIGLNGVGKFVQPYCLDGRDFIRQATTRLSNTDYSVQVPKKGAPITAKADHSHFYIRPKIFSHYVMNLPASALSFLPSFIGIFPSSARQHFLPVGVNKMPLMHVYCFQAKSASASEAKELVLADISRYLDIDMHEHADELEIREVRNVAPNKTMFCASFRLPPVVAFAKEINKN